MQPAAGKPRVGGVKSVRADKVFRHVLRGLFCVATVRFLEVCTRVFGYNSRMSEDYIKLIESSEALRRQSGQLAQVQAEIIAELYEVIDKAHRLVEQAEALRDAQNGRPPAQ